MKSCSGVRIGLSPTCRVAICRIWDGHAMVGYLGEEKGKKRKIKD